VDTRLVKRRLTTFTQTHRLYVAAQRKVKAAEARVSAAQARVNECDREQDAHVELLALALMRERRLRINPFRGFGVPSPAVMKRLAVADEAQAIHRLVAAVRRRCSPATVKVAEAADAAARAQRVKRNVIGQSWDRDAAILKRAAHAAADDGAPHLHAALFRHAKQRAKQSRRVVRRQPKGTRRRTRVRRS
jgi:hypothetical protein